MEMNEIRLIGIKIPLIEKSMSLAELIISMAKKQDIDIEDNDIIVVTSKVLLKSLGKTIDLSKVVPSLRAKIINKLTGKDPVETELILRNSRRCFFIASTKFLGRFAHVFGRNIKDAKKAAELVKAIMFVETSNGFIATDAGLDYSNVPLGQAIVSNHDFDAMAEKLRNEIRQLTGYEVAVVVADTEFTISNGKFGTVDVAVGSSGIAPISKEFGSRDLYGRPKFGGLDITIDELCSAAALLMKQSGEGVPIVLIKGFKYEKSFLHSKDALITRFEHISTKIIIKTVLKNLLLKILRII